MLVVVVVAVTAAVVGVGNSWMLKFGSRMIYVWMWEKEKSKKRNRRWNLNTQLGAVYVIVHLDVVLLGTFARLEYTCLKQNGESLVG